MPVKRLNDRDISSIDPPVVGRKQDIYWDDKLTGFGLRVTASCKTFIVETRVKGRTRRISIGKFGPLSTTEARDRGKKLLAQMLDGVDPNKAKAAEKAKGITLSEVFEEYKCRKVLRPKTVAVYDGAFERCLSDWATKRITDITKDMVEHRYKKLCSSNWQRGTSGHAQASQGMRLLSALLNFAMNVYEDAEGKPLLTYNAVTRLSHVQRGWSRGLRRQGVILDSELRAFYQGIASLRNETARDYLMFLVLTGLRRNEAAALRWDEVDLNNGFLTIPPERTKNKQPHALPLPEFLHNMLKRRDASNDGVSEYVFPGSGKNKRGYYGECKSAYMKVGERMKKKFMPHDLRRTFITVAERLRIEHYALKRLLNHSNASDVTAGYIITEIDRLRQPMHDINAFILKNMDLDPAGNPLNVVSIVDHVAQKQA